MTPKLAKIALVAIVLVAGFGTATTTAAAGTTSQQDGTDEVRIVDEEVTISDALITVSDTTITGPFDSDEHVEEQTYTVDSTVEIDGLHLTIDGTEYVICQIDIHVENVGLHIEDTTVESTEE
jgi:hypothetical protein